MQALSAALAISPPRASSSRTRWPLPVPPMAGLQGMLSGVVPHTGAVYGVKAAVAATGTHLGGRIVVGEVVRASGPDGLSAALPLTQALIRLGLSIRRFKTGTPPRVNARSVDFSKMELQEGDGEGLAFSFQTERPPENRAVCWLTYTNEDTHKIIRANLSRSPPRCG